MKIQSKRLNKSLLLSFLNLGKRSHVYQTHRSVVVLCRIELFPIFLVILVNPCLQSLFSTNLLRKLVIRSPNNRLKLPILNAQWRYPRHSDRNLIREVKPLLFEHIELERREVLVILPLRVGLRQGSWEREVPAHKRLEVDLGRSGSDHVHRGVVDKAQRLGLRLGLLPVFQLLLLL